jgi:alpha-galactosidase
MTEKQYERRKYLIDMRDAHEKQLLLSNLSEEQRQYRIDSIKKWNRELRLIDLGFEDDL